MSSLKQIEANRRNALKSTGPTTPEGKERSRRNAVLHGLTAEAVIAVLEDAEDYQAFEAAVIADYDAESAVERELVLRLASVLWRLRRATGIETALFESMTADNSKIEHGSSHPPLVEAADLSNRNEMHLVATQQSDRAAGNEPGFFTNNDIADNCSRLAALPTFALDRLSRYEHLLWRQARQIVLTLDTTVIETAGSTSLAEIANNYFLYAAGGSSGPELKYAGPAVVAGQFSSWALIGAEQTASGYEITWKVTGCRPQLERGVLKSAA